MILRKTFRFEASHILPKHPGKCSRLHGHSWVLHVETEGQINKETGFVMDYAEMSAVVKPIVERLDHHHLGAWTDLFHKPMTDRHLDNVVMGMAEDFYPSSENLLFWIGEELASVRFPWSKLAIEETCTSYAELKLDEFMVWYTNTYGLERATLALSGWKSR